MQKFIRWLLSYSGFVWTVSIIFVLYYTLSPLVKNVIAASVWKVTDCYANVDPAKYMVKYTYEFNGETYHATRIDFWEHTEYPEKGIKGVQRPAPNDYCYVNPRNPKESVFRADAQKNMSRGKDRVILDLLVLGVAFGVTHWKPAKKKRT